MFFTSSDKTGGAEVFTLPAVTCTFLGGCVFIYTLEVTEKMNVKKNKSIMIYFLLFIMFLR